MGNVVRELPSSGNFEHPLSSTELVRKVEESHRTQLDRPSLPRSRPPAKEPVMAKAGVLVSVRKSSRKNDRSFLPADRSLADAVPEGALPIRETGAFFVSGVALR